mmetsp:Transcript_3062/g.8353  ORF Transcript_3062/g.8353 Transcript_3062/m.8353 type:complete len:334 (+) Transcript_3062:621-1622(+)
MVRETSDLGHQAAARLARRDRGCELHGQAGGSRGEQQQGIFEDGFERCPGNTGAVQRHCRSSGRRQASHAAAGEAGREVEHPGRSRRHRKARSVTGGLFYCKMCTSLIPCMYCFINLIRVRVRAQSPLQTSADVPFLALTQRSPGEVLGKLGEFWAVRCAQSLLELSGGFPLRDGLVVESSTKLALHKIRALVASHEGLEVVHPPSARLVLIDGWGALLHVMKIVVRHLGLAIGVLGWGGDDLGERVPALDVPIGDPIGSLHPFGGLVHLILSVNDDENLTPRVCDETVPCHPTRERGAHVNRVLDKHGHPQEQFVAGGIRIRPQGEFLARVV